MPHTQPGSCLPVLPTCTALLLVCMFAKMGARMALCAAAPPDLHAKMLENLR
jgi:hypothetical protein